MLFANGRLNPLWHSLCQQGQHAARRTLRESRGAGTAMRAFSSDVPAESLVTVTRRADPDSGYDVAEVRMNRAPVNSLSTPLLETLKNTILDLEKDPDVRGLILGSSTKVFSAGLDLNEVHGVDKESFLKYWDGFEQLWKTLYLSPLATAACIESHAPAGGAILSLACDLRVLKEDPKIKLGLNETQLGMVPPRWLQQLVARTCGHRNSEVILQSGFMMDPDTAAGYSFVDFLVGKDMDAWAETHLMLKVLSDVPPCARAATKQQQRGGLTELMGAEISGEELYQSLQTEEAKAIMDATMAKLKGGKKK